MTKEYISVSRHEEKNAEEEGKEAGGRMEGEGTRKGKKEKSGGVKERTRIPESANKPHHTTGRWWVE
jgi:hypothetical protein